MTDKVDNRTLLERFHNGDETALEELTESNMGLVKSAAKRFIGRGTDYEDLVQIGSIGLIKAARSFDLSLEYQFSTYAFTMIIGEIRRFLRDDGIIKISRTIKKNCALLLAEKEKYVERFGREPSISELADICGLEKEDAVICIGALNPVISFNGYADEIDEGLTPEDRTGTDEISDFTEKLALREALDCLDENERIIIELRYISGLTQQSVAERLNTTQVRISRTEKKILEKLRKFLQ